MKTGINFRSLIDGTIAASMDKLNLSNYQDRNLLIDYLESRLVDADWISIYNGTSFEKKSDLRSDKMKTENEKIQVDFEQKVFNF
jgi:hypothetical protein